MAWLVGTLTMGYLHAGWQKNYNHTHRRNTDGSVANYSLRRGILLLI